MNVIDLTARMERQELAARVRDLEFELHIIKTMYRSARDELDQVLGARLPHGETGSAAPAAFVAALRFGARDTAVRLEAGGHPVTLVLGQDGTGQASPDTEGWAWGRVEQLVDEAAMLAGEFVLLRKPLPDPVAVMVLRLDGGRLVAVVSARTRRRALRAALRAAQAAGGAR